jgi:DNA-binding transcriptional ArsR family regulator
MTAQTIRRPASQHEIDARLFKALMHPARLAILGILREGEACVCHMEAALGYRQAYISQQLIVLRDIGLVQDRREGWNIYYRVTEPRVFTVIDAAQGILGKTHRAAGRDPAIAKPCPCPKCDPADVAAAN